MTEVTKTSQSSMTEIQSEVENTPQTPQQVPVAPQTPPEPITPSKSKNWLIIKILIILIILIGLVIGGFFVWKNIFVPKEGKPVEVEAVYKGVWLPGINQNYLATNMQKMKNLGLNTMNWFQNSISVGLNFFGDLKCLR